MIGAATQAAQAAQAEPFDPHRWLEEVRGPRIDAWLDEQSEVLRKGLVADPLFDELHEVAATVLNSAVRVPRVDQKGSHLYNLWQDPAHPRGIYRRTTRAAMSQAEAAWETVLDIDRLAAEEDETWSFAGMRCLPPEERRCLLFLSRGGGDATVMREFDIATREFVTRGFTLGEGKMNVNWLDEDRLLVASDFGAGSMTDSGYARTLRLWRRGEPVTEARELFAGERNSIGVQGYRLHSAAGGVDLVDHGLTFWSSRYYHLSASGLVPLQLPEDATVEGAYEDLLVVRLHRPWKREGRSYPAGALLAAPLSVLEGGDGEIEPIVAEVANGGIEQVAVTSAGVAVITLENVANRLYIYRRVPGEGWRALGVDLPGPGALGIVSSSALEAQFYVLHEGFLSPPSLWMVDAARASAEHLVSQPPQFASERFGVTQYFARSRDGTRVPYYVVMAKDARLDGTNPTHLFSYGGFRTSLTPSYSGSYERLEGAYGKLWLERGGVFVSANIRGGGEYGPAWHEAAMLQNRVRAFEDFEAVAGDLIARGITSPQRLGIEGRSNGGLLVAATMIRRPELYGAVICGVPLLDMLRYTELGAGASWIAEYGDPRRPDDAAFIAAYSPYQNVSREARYPPLFIYSSTLDDRVHPGHGRKMTALMAGMGHRVYYYENREGGHSGNATNDQLAWRLALAYTHLWRELGPPRQR